MTSPLGRRPERTHPPGARRPARPTGWHERLVALLGAGVGRRAACAGDRVFALERAGGQAQFALVVRSAVDPPRRPGSCSTRRAGPPTPPSAIDWYHPSPDGRPGGLRHVARGATSARRCGCSTSRPASTWPDEIPDTRAASVGWLPDASGFLYTRYPEGDEYHRHGVRPYPRHRLARRPAGVGRPADAGELARRQRCRPTAAGPGPRARRVGAGRRAPPRPLERCVAHARRRARRHHPLRLRRRPPGRHHDVRRPRGRVVAVALDDPGAEWQTLVPRGRRRHRELPAGRRHAARHVEPIRREPPPPLRRRRRATGGGRPARARLAGRLRRRGAPGDGVPPARVVHPARRPVPLDARRRAAAVGDRR